MVNNECITMLSGQCEHAKGMINIDTYQIFSGILRYWLSEAGMLGYPSRNLGYWDIGHEKIGIRVSLWDKIMGQNVLWGLTFAS